MIGRAPARARSGAGPQAGRTDASVGVRLLARCAWLALLLAAPGWAQNDGAEPGEPRLEAVSSAQVGCLSGPAPECVPARDPLAPAFWKAATSVPCSAPANGRHPLRGLAEFARTQGAAAIPFLERTADRCDGPYGLRAVQALSLTPGPEGIAALERQARSGRHREVAIGLLTELGEPSSAEFLRVLREEETDSRLLPQIIRAHEQASHPDQCALALTERHYWGARCFYVCPRDPETLWRESFLLDRVLASCAATSPRGQYLLVPELPARGWLRVIGAASAAFGLAFLAGAVVRARTRRVYALPWLLGATAALACGGLLLWKSIG